MFTGLRSIKRKLVAVHLAGLLVYQPLGENQLQCTMKVYCFINCIRKTGYSVHTCRHTGYREIGDSEPCRFTGLPANNGNLVTVYNAGLLVYQPVRENWLKGQSNQIFDLQFFSSFEPAWATDQWVKTVSFLVQFLLRYSYFSGVLRSIILRGT